MKNPGQKETWMSEIVTGTGLSDAELWAVKTAKSLLRVLHRDSGGLNDCAAYLQKRLSIDGNQANRLIDYLERSEFIAAPDENGDRKFL
jgi:DNA segregation ATPase FtsK/SpoIIIE-like protein